MNGRKYGYIKLIGKNENGLIYLEAMQDKGINIKDIFIEKQSGTDKAQFISLKRKLKKGDILYIQTLNHLGCNYSEILKQWIDITRKIEADIALLNMPLLDTYNYKDKVGTFSSELVIEILSWVEGQERQPTKIDLQRSKGAEDSLKCRAVGRPKIEINEKFIYFYDRWKLGEITAVNAMKEIGVKKTTFYKLAKQYENSSRQHNL